MSRLACIVFAIGLTILSSASFGTAATIPQGFPTPPPVPPERPVGVTKYGLSVTDPYRYFEDMNDPAVIDFFKAQNAYTRAVLAKLGDARSQLFDRIAALDNAGSTVAGRNAGWPVFLL